MINFYPSPNRNINKLPVAYATQWKKVALSMSSSSDSSIANNNNTAVNSSSKPKKQQKEGSPNVGNRQKKMLQSKGNNNNNNNNNAALPVVQQTLDELRQVRLQKVESLLSLQHNPYAYSFHNTHSSTALHRQFASLPNGAEDSSGIIVSLAGRVMTRRTFGKLAFFTLQDAEGQIQLYVDQARLGEAPFAQLRDLSDVGDIIGVTGNMKRTDKGELSIYVQHWTMLTKSLLPLPDKYHGLTDVNKRYRHRHLDFIANPAIKQTFRQRAAIITQMRSILDNLGYLEVETPILQTQPGGAEARPFETFHHALDTPMTLRIATELHLKRLVVGGFDKVYEIGRIFRNEGLSSRHNPEFTSVELYCAYADYEDMMTLAETLLCSLCETLHQGATQIEYQGHTIDLSRPWRRVSMGDSVTQALPGVSLERFIAANDLLGAKTHVRTQLSATQQFTQIDRAAFDKVDSPGALLQLLFETFVESTLIQPTFITEHPQDTSPLAKPHRDVSRKKGLTERFELFVVGRELANAFSELTDPVDQAKRFAVQALKKQAGDEEACGLDEDFLSALETGLPPTAGMGIGIDRLVMLLTNASNIRDVIAFPTLRPESK